jgi:uncharacterized membrane-anchored protein
MGRVRAADTVVTGRARLDRRTKDLVRRLQPGEIAVIDHPDLDRVAAEALVAAGAAAVVNAAPSITGRYPNGGPIRVVRAGIPLVDDLGEAVFTEIREGDEVRVDGGEVWVGDRRVATGRRREAAEIEAAMEAAKANIGAELERFAANTLEYIRTEAHGTFEPVRLPPLRTQIRGRHALVVVRGHDYRDDLRALRAYIREFRPVLIGVDGGADALLDAGLRPDLIVGDFDSLSERGWRCGAQLIHHVHRDGRAPGREHLVARGVAYDEIVMDGTSEDVAMILAYEAGASLIVAVGTHATMVEFLDKGRRGMSSTFLTRLRLGPVLVDAKGVSRLYEGRVRRRDVYALIAAALVAMLVVTIVSEPLHVFLDGVRLTLEELWYALTGRT